MSTVGKTKNGCSETPKQQEFSKKSYSNDLETILRENIKNVDTRLKIVLISSMIVGILSHGMALFNKYSNHDDITSLFGVGTTFTSGRWMLGILDLLSNRFTLGTHFSLPLFNGVLSLLFIAFSAYLIVNLLDIQQHGLCAAVAGIMIAFPTVTGIFGYMFTAHYYFLSLFLAVLSAWMICKKNNWFGFLIAIVSIACSMGIYQAFIPVTLSLLVVYYFFYVNRTEDKIGRMLTYGCYLLLAILGGVALYFLINKLVLLVLHLELSDYRNVNQMGKEGILIYFPRILDAYRSVFSLYKIGNTDGIKILHLICFLCVFFLSGVIVLQNFKTRPIKGIILTLLMILFPLAEGFINVMVDVELIHVLMVYPYVMVFVFLARLLDRFHVSSIICARSVYCLGVALLTINVVGYCRMDNICYLMADLAQQRAISWSTVLITRIKSTNGYDDAMPVVFINADEKKDLTLQSMDSLEKYSIIAPYWDVDRAINAYSQEAFMSKWCAFSPTYADSEQFENLTEVQKMPCYPDDGSIKIINGTVCVKF